MAADYFPLSRKSAAEEGFNWSEYEAPAPGAGQLVMGSNLPDGITDVTSEVTSLSIRCVNSGRLFRIVERELEFYRKMNIPLPPYHGDVRYRARLESRRRRTLTPARCSKCLQDVFTSLPESHSRKALCESCYRDSVN